MPEGLRVLLDQNVPRAVASWLRSQRPDWTIQHASEVQMGSWSDKDIFDWAQHQQAIVITFDEDFADQRSFPVGTHAGVIRLRVWPTTVEETQTALQRLLEAATEEELRGALVIVDRMRIRIRPA